MQRVLCYFVTDADLVCSFRRTFGHSWRTLLSREQIHPAVPPGSFLHVRGIRAKLDSCVAFRRFATVGCRPASDFKLTGPHRARLAHLQFVRLPLLSTFLDGVPLGDAVDLQRRFGAQALLYRAWALPDFARATRRLHKHWTP
mmetsp:Transcript_63972/g.208687  ORF Transcript_63972/g.208687 Transcript_63972/m.208687 type:complete len:143 (-) Transcript_63972:1397-1825(-)